MVYKPRTFGEFRLMPMHSVRMQTIGRGILGLGTLLRYGIELLDAIRQRRHVPRQADDNSKPQASPSGHD
jgi:hypothetical protein